MAISQVGTDTVLAYTSRTNSTPTLPTGTTTGDYVVMSIFIGGTSTVVASIGVPAAPAGMELLRSVPAVGSGGFWASMAVYGGFITSAPTIVHATASTEVITATYRGVHPTLPHDWTSWTSGTGTTTTWADVITDTNADQVLLVGGFWGGTPGAAPTGYTNRATGAVSYLEDKNLATAGSVGTPSHTNGNSAGNPWMALTVTLHPSGATVNGGTTAGAAVLAAQSSTAALKILLMGDSLMEGYQATTRALAMPSQLTKQLRTALGLTGGEGVSYAAGAGYAGPAWATPMTGSTVSNSTNTLGTKGDSLTSTQFRELVVTCDSFDVVAYQGGTGSGSSLEVRVDTVLIDTINLATGSANASTIKHYSVTSGSHTIRVTAPSGSTAVVDAIVPYSSGGYTGGIEMWDGTRTGMESDWPLSVAAFAQGWANLGPHLIIDDLMGVNDLANSSRTPTAVATNVTNRIAAYKTLASNPTIIMVLWCVTPLTSANNGLGFSWTDYAPAAKTAALNAGAIVLDMRTTWPSGMPTEERYDTVGHPNDVSWPVVAHLITEKVFNVVTGAASLALTPADPAGGTDSAAAVQALVRGPADPAGGTDAASSLQALVRGPADPGGATDSASAQLAGVRTPADPAGGTDTVSVIASVDRQVADAAGITDTVTALLGPARAMDDPAGGTDTVTTVLAVDRQPADPAGGTDTATLVQLLDRTTSDTAGATDAVNVDLTTGGGTGYTQNPADPAAGTDATTAILSAARALADAAGATDALTVVISRFVTVSDIAGGTDVATTSSGGATNDPARTRYVGPSDRTRSISASDRTRTILASDRTITVGGTP